MQDSYAFSEGQIENIFIHRSFSIRAEIDRDYNYVHVFVKDFLDHFDWLEYKDQQYLITFKISSFNVEIFDRNIPMQGQNAMLSVFGRFVANKAVVCPVFLKYSFKKFQTPRTQQYKKKFSCTDDITKMLKSVPGKVYFQFQKSGKGGYSFQTDKVVNSFAWILPWFEEIIQKVNHLEIDGSYYALPNYCYCLWHGVFHNESVPLALTVYPTESKKLYSIIIDCMKVFGIDENLIKGRIVLADMGDSIESFCNDFNMPLLLCHRHLIENFGSKSPIGTMVTRLLKVKTETEFYRVAAEIDAELKEYINTKKMISKIDDNTMKNIKNLKIMISGFNGDPKSKYYIFKWARFIRIEYHMGRCSNHSEGAHGNINSSFDRRGSANFSTGLSAIINYILNSIQNRKTNHGSSFGRYHSKIRKKMIKFLSNFKERDSLLQKCNCQCREEEYNESLYGIKFPCYHTIIKNIYLSRELSNFEKLNSVNIENFLTYFLQVPKNYGRIYTNEELLHKCNEIVEHYRKEGIKLDENSTFSFICYLFSVLSYNLPEDLEIKIDYNNNIFKIDECTTPILIKDKSKTNKKKQKYVKCDDLLFWTRNPL